MGMLLLGTVTLVVGLLLASLVTRLSVSTLRTTVVAAIVIFGALAMIVLLMSGRIGLAIAIGAYVFWLLRLARTSQPPQEPPTSPRQSGQMSRAQALDVLGLEVGAQPNDIDAAYKALIVKNHPDQGGTDWLAAQLNEARDVLMRDFT
ncbi:MAG: molecular chaperone DnaJ [Parvibaculales bacterium]